MQAGRLNQPVALLRRDVALSSSGSRQPVEDFVHVATVWAEVKPVSGREGFTALERTADATHAFKIRWRADIDATWRLRWDGVEFGISDIRPGGGRLREFLDIVATAGKAENASR